MNSIIWEEINRDKPRLDQPNNPTYGRHLRPGSVGSSPEYSHRVRRAAERSTVVADVASNLSKENAQYSPFEFQPIMRRSTLAIWPTLCRVTAFLAPVSPPFCFLGKMIPCWNSERFYSCIISRINSENLLTCFHIEASVTGTSGESSLQPISPTSQAAWPSYSYEHNLFVFTRKAAQPCCARAVLYRLIIFFETLFDKWEKNIFRLAHSLIF